MSKKVLDFLLSKFFALLLHLTVHLIQIIIKVLKNHVQLIRNKQHLFEFDNIGMIQFTQGLYFAKFDALVPTGIFLFHFFDGDDLVIGIHGLEDHPVGAVADRLHYLILLHNYQL
jgi:hypothetical protein